ncbi:hypothetical protein GCM10010339_47480 [Streptomyces alanosinicus]|uniref:GNAT-like C-terminal domain-containing protein n=1 Tax=Streptomyces alanosinicus TaxID=68171 RepID=A0A918YL46_9ACTN|nr:hypothetical protein GCM10010339_47480 [Streptomyces alanosinicus]
MEQPVRARWLSDEEEQKLQRIVRRGSTNAVRYRRALIVLASAGGNTAPVIARLMQADEDTVRDVIHAFNDKGLACLDPRWAGGRPRLLAGDDEDFVVQTAATRLGVLGLPFTRWSIRKLAAYLRKAPGRCIRIGREALRTLLLRHQITFQHTKTWKESPDPERDTKLDRIEEVLEHFPDRVLAATSAEAQLLCQRAFSRRIGAVSTMAFGNNPVSMKYRGLLRLTKRGPSNEDGWKYQLLYQGAMGGHTLADAFGMWAMRWSARTTTTQTGV